MIGTRINNHLRSECLLAMLTSTHERAETPSTIARQPGRWVHEAMKNSEKKTRKVFFRPKAKAQKL